MAFRFIHSTHRCPDFCQKMKIYLSSIIVHSQIRFQLALQIINFCLKPSDMSHVLLVSLRRIVNESCTVKDR